MSDIIAERSEVLKQLSDLETEKRRLEELEQAYAIVSRSKFAELQRVVAGVAGLFGVGGSRTGAGSAALLQRGRRRAGGKRGALVRDLRSELQRVEADRATLSDLLELERGGQGRADAYEAWRAKHAFRPADTDRIRAIYEMFPIRPKFSVLMPTYDTDETHLRAAIDSVLAQAYPDWELCIADDASPSSHVRAVLEEYTRKDDRIKVVFRAENGHISVATNTALEMATGDFIVLFDHDDLLTPDALFEFAFEINRAPAVDMLYSDEDKIDDDGRLFEPFFKPDWSPDSFLSRMYTCHLGAYRRSLAQEIGGFREGFEGSQDHDFVLRFSERTDRIEHVPRVLYHWRVHENSTAAVSSAKPYAAVAGAKAVAEAIERRGEPGNVVRSDEASSIFVVRYALKDKRKVAIVIPTRDHGDDVDRCLRSIFDRASYANFEVIVVDNGSTDRESLATFDAWTKRESRVRVLRVDEPFNFSRLNNAAVASSDAPYVLLLNNDTEVITRDWLEAMVEQVQRPSIGVVGPILYYPDDTIQHAGVVLGLGGIAGHGHKDFPRDHPGYFRMLQAVNNVSAVTAACLMVRRDVYDAVGGFDETLAVAFNDVDFCLKVGAAGYNNVLLPHVKLYHFESKSRGAEDTQDKLERFRREIAIMEARWPAEIARDRFYSDHFSKHSPGFKIAV